MSKRLIYIVEDEPEMREILTEALGHGGYDAEAMADGAGLLHMMRRETPDLILMDIGLPDMTGWELQRRLQEDLRSRDVPVIALTGYGGGAGDRAALQRLKFADYLRKPYSLAELINRIEVVMERDQEHQFTLREEP